MRQSQSPHWITNVCPEQDVQLTAANDDNYFVFEDMIYQVMLAFSRDTEVTRLSRL